MNPYAACIQPPRLQQLGATDVVTSQEGLQVLSPAKNTMVKRALAKLYGASMGEENDDFGQYTRILGLPCAQAKAAVGENACDVSMLALAQSSTIPVVVAFQSVSDQSATLYLPKDLSTAAALAQPGSTNAIFDPNQPEPKAEKSETGTALVSAAVGGGAGYLVAGPVGGIVGAAVGWGVANWLA